jgi:hypothetical protein
MMESPRLCAICDKRRPKRFCPGIGADICPVCCGTEREVTVNCPLDCVYLQEARRHERLQEPDPRDFPNTDVRVDESFLQKNEALLVLLASAIARGALATSGAIDNDVKAALDGLVRTYKTLQSGLVYDARPENPLAARIYTAVQEATEDVRTRLAEHGQSLRDSDVLGILAFLQRVEIQRNNGRPKGRAFIDFLRGFFPAGGPNPAESGPDSGSLIHTS